MSQNLDKKICILVDALSIGGAEKAASVLSRLLSEEGYQVALVSLRDEITYNFSGKLFNLGKEHSKFKIVKQIQKLSRLYFAIDNIEPDYIIDFRMRDRWFMELMIYFFIFRRYKGKLIYRINSFNIDWHLPKGSFFRKIYGKETLVAVSSDIKNKLEEDYGFNNVNYIPNTVRFDKEIKEDEVELDNNYVLAVGSLRNETKQFDKLIDVFSKSSLIKKGYLLYILGDGEDRGLLQTQISTLDLDENIKLLGYKKDIQAYMKKSKYLVVCSKVEGFPNVILEALNLNTPVISFDCKSGPNEMIIHNENGLLVKNQNFDALQLGMEKLIEDVVLYSKCKSQTDITLNKFKPNTVLSMWKQLFVSK
ncbi:glycosyltransferase [Algibacter sp. TI.3.09]|uniref:glycosyltransferase n=1 Tax=Algibacter sp. TI.3.09 TaxID=3121298 RepID=UPI00311FB389